MQKRHILYIIFDSFLSDCRFLIDNINIVYVYVLTVAQFQTKQ